MHGGWRDAGKGGGMIVGIGWDGDSKYGEHVLLVEPRCNL